MLNYWSEYELQFLKDNYLNMSYKEISKHLDRTLSAVQLKLRRLGLKQPKKYYYNEKFFSDIKQENQAYWLGFICADGYVCKNKSSFELGIELGKIDTYHLELFNSNINSNIPIKMRTRTLNGKQHTTSLIRVYNKHIVEDLMKLGITQNKSLVVKLPNIPNELYPIFIRGYFDGNGTVCRDKDRRCLRFCITSGSLSLIKSLQKLLRQYDISSYYSKTAKDNKSYQLHIRGLHNSVRFGELIYSNSNIYLSRKKEKYLSILQEYNIYDRI